MQRVDAKNRSSIVDFVLILLKSIMLNIILRVFIKDLTNIEVRKKVTRDMTFTNRSLKTIYQLTEKTRRTNPKIQKFFDDELKQDELIFYKSLAQQNISTHQIQAMLTNYHVNKSHSSHQAFSSFAS